MEENVSQENLKREMVVEAISLILITIVQVILVGYYFISNEFLPLGVLLGTTIVLPFIAKAILRGGYKYDRQN